MRPVARAVPAAAFAVLVSSGCASDGDRLVRIEERLDALDRRVAEIDERTRPRLWVPTVTSPQPGVQWRVIAGPPPELNWRMQGIPETWRPILEEGGCVLPIGTRAVSVRSIEFVPAPGDVHR